jgi:prevent-host-death family protein
MTTVNMLEAKTNLSRLVEAVESGAETEIVIARNGRPAARLVPVRRPNKGRRLGVAKDAFRVPDTIDADNTIVEALLTGHLP